jgi:hypothetical protein
LNRARSNLIRAKADMRIPEVYLEDLCFDAQQAAEKAVKAILLHGGRLRDLSIPAGTVWLLTDIAEVKGRQTLYTQQAPQVLKALREAAVV